ncbi:hypothetical protein, partial [Novipirellula herctigrandis]|uniref:hypothetical protein n=1 Tax=Novipirellula herctigrandis TaxID=2527986 RepID=UPI003AF36F82
EKDFASLIKVGRSTPDAPQKNTPLRIGETWTQIEVLGRHLRDEPSPLQQNSRHEDLSEER